MTENTDSTKPRTARNPYLAAAGLTGLLAVIAGAAGDHMLQGGLDAQAVERFEVALRYHGIYSVVLLALALAPRATMPRAAWLLFFTGVVVFCGSLYLAALAGLEFMTMATPVGGLTLMAGWCAVIWRGFSRRDPAG